VVPDDVLLLKRHYEERLRHRLAIVAVDVVVEVEVEPYEGVRLYVVEQVDRGSVVVPLHIDPRDGIRYLLRDGLVEDYLYPRVPGIEVKLHILVYLLNGLHQLCYLEHARRVHVILYGDPLKQLLPALDLLLSLHPYNAVYLRHELLEELTVEEVLVAYDGRHLHNIQLPVLHLLDERPDQLRDEAVPRVHGYVLPVFGYQVLLSQPLGLLELCGTHDHVGEVAVLELIYGQDRLKELPAKDKEIRLHGRKRDLQPAEHLGHLVGRVGVWPQADDLPASIRGHHDVNPRQGVPPVLVSLLLLQLVHLSEDVIIVLYRQGRLEHYDVRLANTRQNLLHLSLEILLLVDGDHVYLELRLYVLLDYLLNLSGLVVLLFVASHWEADCHVLYSTELI
jgi:hypothetical protein